MAMGTIDEEGEEIGYVTIKGKACEGRNRGRVYSLGNRNISHGIIGLPSCVREAANHLI